MKIKLIVLGKTIEKYLQEGESIYEKRLSRYCKFEYIVIPELKKMKNFSESEIKNQEGKKILDKLEKSDHLILLDEKGKEFTSVKFSAWIDQKQIQSVKQLVIVVGGAYGFSDEVYHRANQKIALSQMTFSHQMIRLFFLEQLYRAFSIIKNEPYHHE